MVSVMGLEQWSLEDTLTLTLYLIACVEHTRVEHRLECHDVQHKDTQHKNGRGLAINRALDGSTCSD
jgi:hypothetical protein